MEERRRDNAVAAGLVWREAVRQLRRDSSLRARADAAYERGLKCLKRARNSQQLQSEVIGEYYEFLWESGRFQTALKTLKGLERLATRHDLTEQQVSALGQRDSILN